MNEAKRAEIKVPKIAGASNLTIGRWFKRVSDPVSIGEPIVEIDTYNLTHELQAPATGILSSVMVKDGGSVEPGTVIGTIDQVWSGVIDRIGDTSPGRTRTEREDKIAVSIFLNRPTARRKDRPRGRPFSPWAFLVGDKTTDSINA
jgi:pyruvate/2-oxoglutarate dehydrogenase complex dihydrolipoamide acyltransferase (E2) component